MGSFVFATIQSSFLRARIISELSEKISTTHSVSFRLVSSRSAFPILRKTLDSTERIQSIDFYLCIVCVTRAPGSLVFSRDTHEGTSRTSLSAKGTQKSWELYVLFAAAKVNTYTWEERDKRQNENILYIFDRGLRLDPFRRKLEESAGRWEGEGKKGTRRCWIYSNICIFRRIILRPVSSMFAAFNSSICGWIVNTIQGDKYVRNHRPSKKLKRQKNHNVCRISFFRSRSNEQSFESISRDVRIKILSQMNERLASVPSRTRLERTPALYGESFFGNNTKGMHNSRYTL